MSEATRILRYVRLWLGFFMLALIASGLTAIPLQWEIGTLSQWFGPTLKAISPASAAWISRVKEGVQNGYGRYPFLAYGTDWLAFGHIAIAVAFIGALRDPVRNLWVVEFGMIACAMVIPWALIFGQVRGIPPLWTVVDMSFGIIGIIPLWVARSAISRLGQRMPGAYAPRLSRREA